MLDEIKEMMRVDLDLAFEELQEVAEINGQAGVPCICTPRTRGKTVDDVGSMPTAALQMIIRTTGLTTTPEPLQLVTFKGRYYRIADIQVNPDENAMVLILVDEAG